MTIGKAASDESKTRLKSNQFRIVNHSAVLDALVPLKVLPFAAFDPAVPAVLECRWRSQDPDSLQWHS